MTIRRIPEDFLVNEVLDPRFLAALRPEPDALARGALYRLSKVSMTTPDAARDLARTLGVKVPDVTYAGLKDRHARTAQHVRVESRPGLRLPTVVAGASWNAELLGYTSEPLDAGRIERNRFEIVVRGLSRKASQEMLRRARLLSMETPEADSVALLIANYFGAQRFGSARHGHGWIAEALIRGDFEHALRLAIGTPSRKDSGATRNFTRACAAR